MADLSQIPASSDSSFRNNDLDLVLQAIVDLVNRLRLEIPITLSVNGLIVSGMLSPGERYFEQIADETLRSADLGDQSEVQKSFSEYLRGLGKLIYGDESMKSGYVEDEGPKQLPEMIHLRDAKFIHNSGEGIPSNRGIWWRGRLSEVDGFSFGMITSS